MLILANMTRSGVERRERDEKRFDVQVDPRPIAQHIMRMLRGETRSENVRLTLQVIQDLLVRSITVSAFVRSRDNGFKIVGSLELSPTLVDRADSRRIPDIIKELAELWVGRAEITPTADGYHLLINGPTTPIHVTLKVWGTGSDHPTENPIEIATDDLEIDPDKKGSRKIIEGVIEEYAEILAELIEALYRVLGVTPVLGGKELQLKIVNDDSDGEEYALD